MKILLIEPYFSGSHKRWAEELVRHSSNDITLLTLPGRHWKWRMHGASITLAAKANSLHKFDLLIVSDMLDLTTFKSMYKYPTKTLLYMHENQITYPFNNKPKDHDNHYGWINFTSCLVADKIAFNSDYHRNIFLDSLPKFLHQFPDDLPKDCLFEIKQKSETLWLGMELNKAISVKSNDVPVVLWNHRWEYDKNPEQFFNDLIALKDEINFQLIVLGQSYKSSPRIFEKAKIELSESVIHWGYVDTKKEYLELVRKSDILYVTSNQDFFGGSVVEAISHGVTPLVPNRLAYVDYVPVEHRYDENERILKLKKQLLNFNNSKYNFSSVERFDWLNCINEYDNLFEELAN